MAAITPVAEIFLTVSAGDKPIAADRAFTDAAEVERAVAFDGVGDFCVAVG